MEQLKVATKKKERLLKSALADALNICGGIYKMDASSANRYGFTVTENRKKVFYGEFLFGNEDESHVDWVIDLATNSVRRSLTKEL